MYDLSAMNNIFMETYLEKKCFHFCLSASINFY